MGIDATHKTGPETARAWGRVAQHDEATLRRVDALASRLGL
jgi:4-hydroxy-3-polyprenylbenzoate decarboxylase